MMFVNACKWFMVSVAVPIITGAAGGVLASVILAHYHLA